MTTAMASTGSAIMLTPRRDDGRTGVEIRVARSRCRRRWRPIPRWPACRDQTDQDREEYRRLRLVRRQVEVAVIAELPATLAFYRHELASRNWTEETNGAVITPDNVTLKFSSAEQSATLTLSRQYDLTIVSLTTQMTEAALAARARAKKEADKKFMSDAAAMAKQVIAADEARRVAQAADL